MATALACKNFCDIANIADKSGNMFWENVNYNSATLTCSCYRSAYCPATSYVPSPCSVVFAVPPSLLPTAQPIPKPTIRPTQIPTVKPSIVGGSKNERLANQDSSNSDNATNQAMIGGIIGGILGFFVIAICAFFAYRRWLVSDDKSNINNSDTANVVTNEKGLGGGFLAIQPSFRGIYRQNSQFVGSGTSNSSYTNHAHHPVASVDEEARYDSAHDLLISNNDPIAKTDSNVAVMSPHSK